MEEGLILSEDKAVYYKRTPPNILWRDTGHSMQFRRDAKVGHKLRYRGVELTDLMPPYHTVGLTRNVFHFVPRWTTDTSEVRICVPKLRDDEINVLAVLHEIGHGASMDELYQMVSGMSAPDEHISPLIMGLRRSAFYDYVSYNEIKEGLENELGEHHYKAISERKAWIYALKTARRYGWNFQGDVLGYINEALDSYVPEDKPNLRSSFVFRPEEVAVYLRPN